MGAFQLLRWTENASLFITTSSAILVIMKTLHTFGDEENAFLEKKLLIEVFRILSY